VESIVSLMQLHSPDVDTVKTTTRSFVTMPTIGIIDVLQTDQQLRCTEDKKPSCRSCGPTVPLMSEGQPASDFRSRRKNDFPE